jgi:hypothetical protein
MSSTMKSTFCPARPGRRATGRQTGRRAKSPASKSRSISWPASRQENLGAFLATDADVSLAQAKAADARLAAGERTPLLGVPLAHKDVFVTRDFPTTAGSKMLENYRSPFDATVVEPARPRKAPAWSRWASSTATSSPWARATTTAPTSP